MTLAEDTNCRGRVRLPVVAALVVTALMTPAAGASTAGSSPRSPVPVFVLDRGRFTAFDTPGEAAQDFVGINNRGQIVGGYKEDLSRGEGGCGQRGFLRDKNGRFTRIDVPGAGLTAPIDINDRGQVVGQFQYTGYCPDGADPLRGFLRDRSGRFTIIHVPDSVYTTANGINERGQVVGEYLDADGTIHGYLWDKGRFTTFDGPDGTGAALFDINDRGQIVGAYLDPAEPEEALHGFLLSRGIYTTFDVPGVPLTLPLGINNRGQIAGIAASDVPIVEGVTVYGFVLARGAKGPLTRIDFPGALGTLAADINDRAQIVGIYTNPDAAPDGQPSSMRMPMMMSGSDG
jgi:probable HAF family extracellular repeat protein